MRTFASISVVLCGLSTMSHHTPRPTGPYCTGCLDLMNGRTKNGSLMRIFYPSSLPDITTQKDRWTRWFLEEKYSEGLPKFYLSYVPWIASYLITQRTKDFQVPSVWEGPVKKGKFPVIVMSPGLTTSRTLYSALCSDIASHGFIIAVMEHRDASGCATFTLTEDGKKDWILFRTVGRNESEQKVRKEQIAVRSSEASKALDSLIELNKGTLKNELSSNFDLDTFKGKLELSRPILMGHSFGGGTVYLTLANDHRFVIGASLDPWTFPLEGDWDGIISNLKQPVISIFNETFQTKQNLKPFDMLQNENKYVTVKNGNHQNTTDYPFFLTLPERFIVQAYTSMNSLLAMTLHSKLLLDYFWDKLGIQNEWSEDYKKYLEKKSHYLMPVPHGTAKSMLGWSSLPKSK